MKRTFTIITSALALILVMAVSAADPKQATKDVPWGNSLGMKFVPVKGTDALFCIWDTRVRDYQAFVNATGREWPKPSFKQGQTHPAVNVSWEDAKAFCDWLTKKEQSAEGLQKEQAYRLPTDAEWSVAVGLGKEVGNTPAEKDTKIKDVYPWGWQWPPPRGAGNYLKRLNADDYENTSPVGGFAANEFGLFDMGGNVWQWCEEEYKPGSVTRVSRGSSWGTDVPDALLSSGRCGDYPGLRNDSLGFRCVLVVGTSSSRRDSSTSSE
jgi:formylglycine-generating enzyme required for sulfatase activity